jgi:hypothetical protein
MVEARREERAGAVKCVPITARSLKGSLEQVLMNVPSCAAEMSG